VLIIYKRITGYYGKEMSMLKDSKRCFKCAECGYEFELSSSDKDIKCPKCKNKLLILLEGESLKKNACPS